MDARRLAASVEAILDRAGDGEHLGGDSTSDRHALAIHQLRQLVQRVLPSAWAEGHMLDTGHGAGLGGALVWMGNAHREVDCPITMLPAGIFIRIIFLFFSFLLFIMFSFIHISLLLSIMKFFI